MKRNPFLLAAVLILIALSLAGCGKSEETKKQEAKARLSHGRQQYADNRLEEAGKTFRGVRDGYPGTREAQEAEAWLKAILGKKENELRSACYEVLGRLRDIVEGYQTMYGNYPISLAEIDGSDYFFDSQYIAEAVPADFTVYLVFHGEQRFEVWALQSGKEYGYIYDSATSGFRRFADKSEMLSLEKGRTPKRIGNLVGLPGAPRS